MRIRRFLLSLLFLGIFLPKMQASDTKSIEIASDPSWADLIPLQQLKTENKEESILLHDSQIHVGRAEEFQRIVIRMTSAQAVQRFSQLSFTYDPSYQKLVVNHFRIYRKGAFVDVPVAPEQFRVVQVEKDLERYLYNGSVSALWFLEDIRVGDILDYAVTIQGRNPVFDGHFMENIDLEAESPCALTRYKILAPLDLKLNVKTFNTKIETKTFETGDLRSYEWKLEHTKPPKKQEDDENSDETVASSSKKTEEPYRAPWIQISDFASWEAVRDWSLKYYTITPSDSPEIKAVVEEIKNAHPEKIDQIRAAIQFVQQEVRYLGVEMGASSHQPARPEEVLRRRFGDCKDKAVLLCTLLQTLGVEAGPAFVDAESDPESELMHPSIYAFNHCVAQFNYKGDYYWVDATMETQRGPLDGLYFPAYKMALVPSFKSDPYTRVLPTNKGVPFTEVTEIFDSKDYQQPATLDVTLIFQNLAADQLRSYFLEHEQKELEKVYLKVYQSLYPKISQEGEMVFEDDLEKNVLKVTAKYSIPEFWRWHREYRCYYSVFFAQNIALSMSGAFSSRGSTRCHVRETIDISVPPGARLPSASAQIRNSRVDYSLQGKKVENRMVLNYEYQNRAEFLSKKETAAMNSDLSAIEDSLRYSLIVETAADKTSNQAVPEKKEAKKFY